MYINIEEWGNRRGVVGEGRERDMKGGRGSMKAGVHLGSPGQGITKRRVCMH